MTTAHTSSRIKKCFTDVSFGVDTIYIYIFSPEIPLIIEVLSFTIHRGQNRANKHLCSKRTINQIWYQKIGKEELGTNIHSEFKTLI